MGTKLAEFVLVFLPVCTLFAISSGDPLRCFPGRDPDGGSMGSWVESAALRDIMVTLDHHGECELCPQ